MKATCPTCGATFDVPEDVAVVECPYCGTYFRIATGKQEENLHFYFPPEKEDPFGRLMRFISRQCGVPEDIYRSSTYEKGVLHFVPVYFYHLHGKATVEAKSRKLGEFTTVVEEITDIGIPAIHGKLASLLENYPFPLRGKRFFEPKVKQLGVYYEPEISQEEADKQAKAILDEIIANEASSVAEKVKNIKTEIFKTVYKGLVHYPVWEITYSYGGKRFQGYVDGATGAVILAEYPITLLARMLQIALAALFVISGFLLAGVFLHIGDKGPIAAVYAVLAGIIAAIPLVSRSVKKKLIGSEIELLRKKLKEESFYGKLSEAFRKSPVSIGFS